MPTLTLSIFARDDDMALDVETQCACIFVHYPADDKPVSYYINSAYTTAHWCIDLDRELYLCDDSAEIQVDVYLYTNGKAPAYSAASDFEQDEEWDVLQDQRIVFTLMQGVTVRNRAVNYHMEIEALDTYREGINDTSAFPFVANLRRPDERKKYRISDSAFLLWLKSNGLLHKACSDTKRKGALTTG